MRRSSARTASGRSKLSNSISNMECKVYMIVMFSHMQRKILVGMMGLLALCLVLAGCGGGSNPTAAATPTPTSALGSFTTFKLNLPAEALSAPVKGPLPDDTPMRVAITFKLNQQTMNTLKNSSKSGDLGAHANQLGI